MLRYVTSNEQKNTAMGQYLFSGAARYGTRNSLQARFYQAEILGHLLLTAGEDQISFTLMNVPSFQILFIVD
jgi:hypothetical protein